MSGVYNNSCCVFVEVRQAYDHVDSFAHEMDLFSTLIVILILVFHVLFSASNLER